MYMVKRSNLLLKYVSNGSKRRTALLNMAKGPTRRQALLSQVPWMVTRYKDTKGRSFYVTLRGAHIILINGKPAYGRKAKTCNVPAKMRRKKCS
jgi:hypothetical protein